MFRYSAFLLIALLFSTVGWTQVGDKKPSPVPTANGSAQLDKRLRIKKLFVFPTKDTLGGVLGKRLSRVLLTSLGKNARFTIIRDKNIINAIGLDEGTYRKILNSRKVRAQVAKISKADIIIRMDLKHIGDGFKIQQAWYTADGRLLFLEEGEGKGGKEEKYDSLVTSLTEKIIQQIPFQGNITGRSGNTLTLDLDRTQMSPGDVFEIVRIVSEKRHPLLKTLVGVDYVVTGKARITDSDSVLSFAEIITENSSDGIFVNNKIIGTKKIIAKESPKIETMVEESAVKKTMETTKEMEETQEEPLLDKMFVAGDGRKEDEMPSSEATPIEEETAEELTLNQPEQKSVARYMPKRNPKYGLFGSKFLFGNIYHESTASDGSSSYTSGFAQGVGFFNELWITKYLIFGAEYEFMYGDLDDVADGPEIPDASWKAFNAFLGYRHFIGSNHVMLGLGFQNIDVTLPSIAIKEKGYSGILLKFSGNLQISAKNEIKLSLNIQPFSAFSYEGDISKESENSSVIGISLDWLLRWNNRFSLRVNAYFKSSETTFTDRDTVADSRFYISPGLLYLF